ncbi:hypothetical protein LBMAG42_47300 [Deltaproteobacteria bacterium]|nr:hypothetical protein LBMAG42_47300 [Deltaproteobacteria bacterium]
MRSIILVSFLSLGLPTSLAFACEGEHAAGSHCDMPAASAKAPIPAGSTAANLKVEGMTCGMCVGKVQTALMAVPGVTVANVDVTTGVAEVGYDASKTNVDALVAAVNGTNHFKASKL